jgi:hypothetical protein
MSDLQHLLERFAEMGEQRGADAVFDTAVKTVAHRRKQRRRRAALAAVVAVTVTAAAVVVIVRAQSAKVLRVVTTPTSVSTTTVPAPVSAPLLISGHWGSLAPAPIVARQSPSIAWTGKEMLVWGGISGDAKETLYADGAAYDPLSRTWRRLPAAPLTARQYPAAAWTGTEFVIWGGYTSVAGFAANDGAAYNPATNRWRKLALSPLRPQAGALAVWSGSRLVILSYFSSGAAAYDPETDLWQVLTPPKPAVGASLGWMYALRINDHRLLVWSHADTSTPLGPNSASIRGATTMFIYDESTDEWRLIPTAANAVPDIHEALWTGTQIIVRGDMRDCFTCQGPGPLPEVTASYRPTTNTWSRLPSEPLEAGVIGGGGSVSVWTGAALWSFDPFDPRQGSESSGHVAPRQASVYDPASGRWTRLKTAPFACANIVHPVWTAHEVLIYCPARNTGGLSYIAAR